MPVIVVANPKGGVGKSTLATQVAGYFASRGLAVMLGDVDRQQSSRIWLGLRAPELPAIRAWDIDRDAVARPPKGTTHVVLDTPAGLHGKRLDEVLKLADKLLVPLQPSIFDLHATHGFIQSVQAHKRHGKLDIAVVGVRVREGTHSADQLTQILEKIGVSALARLRDTQNYVHLAARGLTLWDVSASRVERDLLQWQPLLTWLDGGRGSPDLARPRP